MGMVVSYDERMSEKGSHREKEVLEGTSSAWKEEGTRVPVLLGLDERRALERMSTVLRERLLPAPEFRTVNQSHRRANPVATIVARR